MIVIGGELGLTSVGGLEREVGQQRALGSTQIVIDLSDVEFIDPSVFRPCLRCATTHNANGHILMLAPPPSVMRIVTGPRTLLD